MRKTTTTYLCDSCEAKVERAADLERFQLVLVRHGRKPNESVAMDLCGECEGRLLSAVDAFIPNEQRADLLDMRRPS